MTYGNLKHLNWRTASDKVLRDEAFNVAKSPKYGYQHGLALMVIIFLIKKLLVEQLKINLYLIKN